MIRERPTSRNSRVYHGLGGTPTYSTWYMMINRCTDQKNVVWEFYGGRGISVCDEWASIDAFVRDMGLRPDGMTLDRVDPNGNYEKSNCRWATVVEQNRNRTNNVLSREKVEAIRRAIASGLSQSQAGIKFGVSQSSVSRAVRGITWY